MGNPVTKVAVRLGKNGTNTVDITTRLESGEVVVSSGEVRSPKQIVALVEKHYNMLPTITSEEIKKLREERRSQLRSQLPEYKDSEVL